MIIGLFPRGHYRCGTVQESHLTSYSPHANPASQPAINRPGSVRPEVEDASGYLIRRQKTALIGGFCPLFPRYFFTVVVVGAGTLTGVTVVGAGNVTDRIMPVVYRTLLRPVCIMG